MAIDNPNVTADAIALTEYPQIAQRYRVMGVPKTMIDGKDGLEGALPEAAFIDAVLLSVQNPHEQT